MFGFVEGWRGGGLERGEGVGVWYFFCRGWRMEGRWSCGEGEWAATVVEWAGGVVGSGSRGYDRSRSIHSLPNKRV